MSKIDLDSAAKIQAAIEAAGGDIVDFKTDIPEDEGFLGGMRSVLMGSEDTTYYFAVQVDEDPSIEEVEEQIQEDVEEREPAEIELETADLEFNNE